MAKIHEKYNDGKLPKLWEFLVDLHKTNPAAFEADAGYLRAIVAQKWKALEDGTHCPNCRASMQQYSPTFDYFDAKLLEAMAEVVRNNLRSGKEFTEANLVHIQKDTEADYTTKSRQAKCRQLGLIAKHMVDGKHKESKWVITRRGWQVLRGERVPKKVVVFRNEIIGRSDETTTMAEVMHAKQDRFEPRDWYDVASLADGVL